MMEGWRQTYGNAYARIVPNGEQGFPAALEPMHPDEVRPFRGPNNGIFYRWTPSSGREQILTQGEVLHLKDRPARRGNPLEGESKVVRHKEAIGRVLATGEYLSRFFSGNAVPKFAIVLPQGQTLDDVQKQKLIEQFMRRHSGVENAWRPAVFDAGMEPKALGVSNDDAQVVQAYEQAVAQIARVWGIPLHLIGETSKVTSWGSGIEHQSIGFVVYYMRPKFVVWEQALNRALMSQETRRRFFFEFNIDGLLRGDFKSRMDGFALMIQWGLATPNEIRRLMNLPPLAGGDERLTPLNMVPASRIMDVLLSKSAGNQQRDADTATSFLTALIQRANGKDHSEARQ
jgi:HK97 family phage portal protein